MTTPQPSEEDFLDYRQAVNLKSIRRADSSVTDILVTSSYAVIYHYEPEKDSWEKVKQEGPLFVVRRYVDIGDHGLTAQRPHLEHQSVQR